MKSQIFSNNGVIVFCETYLCRNPAKYFIGNPHGPLMLHKNICEECKQSIIKGLLQTDRKKILEKVDEIDAEVRIAKDKEQYNGKEFPCKHCGDISYSPASLAAHMRYCEKAKNAKEKEKATVGGEE